MMSEYQKGFIAGRKAAKEIIEQDVKYITLCDAVVLHQHGNTEEEIRQFISDVQAEWQRLTDLGLPVSALDKYAEEKIGFSIFQEEVTTENEM